MSELHKGIGEQGGHTTGHHRAQGRSLEGMSELKGHIQASMRAPRPPGPRGPRTLIILIILFTLGSLTLLQKMQYQNCAPLKSESFSAFSFSVFLGNAPRQRHAYFNCGFGDRQAYCNEPECSMYQFVAQFVIKSIRYYTSGLSNHQSR